MKHSTKVSSISDQVMSYEIDWFQIQLVGPVEAEELGPDHLEIGQGDALFLLGGQHWRRGTSSSDQERISH
jgi:hypothetical protein